MLTLAFLLIAFSIEVAFAPAANADFKCDFVNGKLVCGQKKGGDQKKEGSEKNKIDDDDDDDDDDKPKKEKEAKNCKKARCEPGMFVLDKPNIYGACCQATAAPLTPKTTPVEPEKCKFPGEVGTPPNCKCPGGSEFFGYKGCLPAKQKSARDYCADNLSKEAQDKFLANCRAGDQDYNCLGSRCCCIHRD